METNFDNFREKQNLIPIKIENKDKYYFDLLNIEHSLTGRLDAQLANTFILESSQLLINAIVLFEQGYFDCAFYSLRQSLEVSTTMVYLIDNDEKVRYEELKKWKNQGRFPMYAQMIKFLTENATVFSDIKDKMSEYFADIDDVKIKLNKYVHKQGFQTFYISRNHPINIIKSYEDFLTEFEHYLKKCMGAIAIFRLTIDPFPVLLTDESIYARTGDLISRGYNANFVEKYIGEEHIEKYKRTELYMNHYNQIIQQEAKETYTLDVVKNQYIDKTQINNILMQKHLLSLHDIVAVVLAGFSEKVAKIYCIGGFHFYFTNINSNRKAWSWNSKSFDDFEKNTQKYNQQYDEAFISYIEIYNEGYFIEHNNEFSENEINELEEIRYTTQNNDFASDS